MADHDQQDARAVYLKLLQSGLFRAYRQAFREATGLPLELRFPDDCGQEPGLDYGYRSPFCRKLEEGRGCSQCLLLQESLEQEARCGLHSVRCFAGMEETAIPVKLGRRTIALLETGHVFFKKPTGKDFVAVARSLVDEGWKPADIEKLRDDYLNGSVVDEPRYRSMLTLLMAFALQLGDLANKLVLEQRGAEPAAVSRAKQFILEHLDEPIRLDDVANHVHVSSYYFCKLFKQATGITFTEFVNRQRIERAKQMLLDPQMRVTEVAFEVGFQSLSQFNRSFLKIVGESPTEFRKDMNDRPGALARA